MGFSPSPGILYIIHSIVSKGKGLKAAKLNQSNC